MFCMRTYIAPKPIKVLLAEVLEIGYEIQIKWAKHYRRKMRQ